MLVRAARRKARSASIRSQHVFDQACSPRHLAACHLNAARHHRWTSNDATSQRRDPRHRRSSNDGALPLARRAMTTAATYEDIPFDNPFLAIPSATSAREELHHGSFIFPEHIEAQSVLQDKLEQHKVRAAKNGITGSITEVLSVYHACLQVGRLERAGVILRRILLKADLTEEEILELHTGYLCAAVEQLSLEPAEFARESIHKWFEVEIRLKAVPYTAQVVAYMLKASLLSPSEETGGNKKRLVRRYMSMVEGEVGLELLGLNVLTARELDEINHICPTSNLAIGIEMPSVDELPVEEFGQGKLPLESAPEVRPASQKGLGLKTLKKALSLFSSLPSEGLAMKDKTLAEKRAIQEQLEADSVRSAIDRWRAESESLKKMGLDSSLQTKSLGARMWRWQEALTAYLKDEILKVDAAELKEVRTPEDESRCIYGPFLRVLSTDKLAAITILTTMTCVGQNGVDRGISLARIIMAIASSLEDEMAMEVVQKRHKNSMWSKKKSYQIHAIKRNAQGRAAGSVARLIDKMESERRNDPSPLGALRMPSTIKAKTGSFLLSALIATAKVPVTLENSVTKEAIRQLQPAFTHAFQVKMGKKHGVITTNPFLVQTLKREPVHALLAKHLPMVVEPEPWKGFSEGGFISHPANVLRIKDGCVDQRHYTEAALGQGDMTELCRGLDVLGKTEWRINQPVFDAMLEAWNSGESVGKLAPDNPNLPVPPEPTSRTDPLERGRWLKEVKEIENHRMALHSQRCFQNFQLEIARALRSESFYFPHNVDFRGRAYPIPPYLNHMGADHCRGLLRFGRGKELGDNGLRWLKIHLANVFGFNKASLKEREGFSDEHLSDLYDSATQPLQGARWWLKAEDPWQCLAVCIELKNAMDSPDPSQFVSHLPVHQDGTCNGLQHYAALGGDLLGAKQVNLEPGERPADVYSAVADVVKQKIAEDKANGNDMAMILDGKITRKTVKQTVMTNVYGVTFIGAMLQVKKQLPTMALPEFSKDSKITPITLASYIARQIFSALGNMFRGAHDIQEWFGQCASMISTSLTAEQVERFEKDLVKFSSEDKSVKAAAIKSMGQNLQFKSTVVWTTPLNMPVVQPYRTTKPRTITTTMQSVKLSEPRRSDSVSKRKQLQAFPPNFIHSLDATHMILSALESDEAGLTFAAVHDSFWTHASDIEKMNSILRDSFIKIHTEDVIGRLAAEFQARHKGSMYSAQLKKDSPAAAKIIEWRRENRAQNIRGLPAVQCGPVSAPLYELDLEHKRMRLLASADPEEVEMGKTMTTPASIIEEFSAEADLLHDQKGSIGGLGEMQMEDEESLGADASSDPHDEREESVEASQDKNPGEEESNFAKTINLSRKYQRQVRPIYVWCPLVFPKLPKKGDFDVSRLKKSQYFFS
ncbi:mitochondrial DNA-directed RNA polymeras-like protein [Amylocarpus encephaloides]|uniref:DNA-directed RNA polymerase n=1 Tax=Amylocarpus encephaloides TaxID=45428 RepID=A0A9P7YPZ3_9HELO|nr:mitochondrial DNA-directed RNA polymeras-like protein [Amylocarpus encephaloides]